MLKSPAAASSNHFPNLLISNTLLLPRQPPNSSRMRCNSAGRSTRSIRSNILCRARAWRACRSSTTRLAHSSNRLIAASIWAMRFCWAR